MADDIRDKGIAQCIAERQGMTPRGAFSKSTFNKGSIELVQTDYPDVDGVLPDETTGEFSLPPAYITAIAGNGKPGNGGKKGSDKDDETGISGKQEEKKDPAVELDFSEFGFDRPIDMPDAYWAALMKVAKKNPDMLRAFISTNMKKISKE